MTNLSKLVRLQRYCADNPMRLVAVRGEVLHRLINVAQAVAPPDTCLVCGERAFCPDGHDDSCPLAALERAVVSEGEPLPEGRLFYVQDTRTIVGNCISWWAKDRCGYTCHLERAHVFTEEEAVQIARGRETDVPWPKDVIDAIAGRMVDHQRLPDREQLSLIAGGAA